MPLAVQSQIGPYKVLSLLGAGATGEVYRARDTRLNRDVAIKILAGPDTEGEALRRFEQEAQAVSALNHPNILIVHDVGREDGIAFLVTELVEGESLRQLLTRGSVSMPEFLDIGIQIADGLAAAHDEGIVHRDLKPENIMVTRDGRVKILDFGIAKVMEEFRGDSTRTLGSNDTAPGLLLGTTAYMSPEQARGARVSYFTDQFSLGVILYEMATGVAAFRRDTPLASLSAILTEEAAELNIGSPLFQWLVKRLLHKEPDHRYASMHDVLRELRNIRTNITELPVPLAPELEEPSVETAPARRIRPKWIAVAMAALASVMLLATLLWYHRPAQVVIAREYTPFATASGLDLFPAWSPSGRTIAYCSEVDGVLQIFTRSPGIGMPAQITSGPDHALRPFWSPGATGIYYISDGDLYSVSAAGGSPELIVRGVANAAIAADGSTLAVLRPDSPDGSVRLYRGTKDHLTLFTSAGFDKRRWQPSSFLASGGQRFGAWLSTKSGASEFWLISFGDEVAEQKLSYLTRSTAAHEFSWLADQRRIVFSGENHHLLVADTNSGRVDPLTAGTGWEQSPSAAAEGRQIAFTSLSSEYDLVRIGFDSGVESLPAATHGEHAPAINRNGEMAFVTDRNGLPEIWLRARESAWERPIVPAAAFGEDTTRWLRETAFAPDGKRIAFRRSGSDDAIWIVTVAGGPPVRLATEPGGASQAGPVWSADGNAIVYFSSRDGENTIERARPGSSQPPVVLARNAGVYPRLSPSGDLIATRAAQGLIVLNADGSKRRNVGSGTWFAHGWGSDDNLVYGIRESQGRRLQLVSLRLQDGEETVRDLGPAPAAYRLTPDPIQGWNLTPKGDGIVTSLLRAASDIWTLKR